jgi:hypothetical protein
MKGMPQTTIDKLIINSPYEEPARHWSYDRENRQFNLEDGRREAGYVIATPQAQQFDDPGVFKLARAKARFDAREEENASFYPCRSRMRERHGSGVFAADVVSARNWCEGALSYPMPAADGMDTNRHLHMGSKGPGRGPFPKKLSWTRLSEYPECDPIAATITPGDQPAKRF